jgi:MFS transporter, putative metabolite:H+ symporter
MRKENNSILNVAVIVAALGYFVDIYDLLLFTIVRKPSLVDIGVTDAGMIAASAKIIDLQMVGLLIGGVVWGIMGDKKGRLSVLFGSIMLYSVANFLTGYVQTVDQYAWARFAAGVGLAGELGAGITLVSELLPKEKRGIGTSLVAGVGLFGAVFAYFIFQATQGWSLPYNILGFEGVIEGGWRLCYKIGGGLGIMLLLLRISVAESGMFHAIKDKKVSQGNFFMFFNNAKRFRKYVLAIMIGLPTWFVIGILVNYSDKFAQALYGANAIDSGRSIMFGYVGIAVSQFFGSRKKALFLFYGLSIVSMLFYFSGANDSDTRMYLACGMLGFSTGFWAIFVTMGAEQFGTNLRATAATTIPNMVRGALPLINYLFLKVFQGSMGWTILQSAAVTGTLVMLIAVTAAWFTEETFHKDLNYVETEEMFP